MAFLRPDFDVFKMSARSPAARSAQPEQNNQVIFVVRNTSRRGFVAPMIPRFGKGQPHVQRGLVLILLYLIFSFFGEKNV
ncbi:MAG: hypothetical protein HOP21_07835 [Methylotenera sp.]|nr:hypothetical protein [Methylotenera sp.]